MIEVIAASRYGIRAANASSVYLAVYVKLKMDLAQSLTVGRGARRSSLRSNKARVFVSVNE